MAKRELRCGYRPLRPWERLFAYVSLIITFGLTFQLASSEGLSLRLTLYAAAMLIALPCAFIAFWDARVSSRLRRREWQQHRNMAASRQVPVLAGSAPRFSEKGQEWSFFDDPTPTTER